MQVSIMMFTCEGACGGEMWSCTGGTKCLIGAFLMHVTIALAFITVYWFLHIFDDYHSGVSDKNAVQEEVISGLRGQAEYFDV